MAERPVTLQLSLFLRRKGRKAAPPLTWLPLIPHFSMAAGPNRLSRKDWDGAAHAFRSFENSSLPFRFHSLPGSSFALWRERAYAGHRTAASRGRLFSLAVNEVGGSSYSGLPRSPFLIGCERSGRASEASEEEGGGGCGD